MASNHEPHNVATISEQTSQTEQPIMSLVVQGWHLAMHEDNQPRILDTDLAEKLGFERPRKIRELISRLDEQGKIPDIYTAPHMERYEIRPGIWHEQKTTAYFLDERNALRVIRRCETDKADELMDEIINVFMLARRGLLPQRAEPTLTRAEVVAIIQESVGPLVRKIEEYAAHPDRFLSRAELRDHPAECDTCKTLISRAA